MKFVGCTWALVFAASAVSPSWAGDRPSGPADLTMLRDKAGHIFLVDDAAYRTAVEQDKAASGDSLYFYFGNERTAHRYQADDKFRRSAKGREASLELLLWDPVKDFSRLRLVRGEKWTLKCDDRERVFEVVPKAVAERIIKKMKIVSRPAFTRMPYLLARDDEAFYYFVERDRAFASAFALYIGARGNMKKQQILRSAKDSAGLLLVTKIGRLKAVRERGGKLQEVIWLPRKGADKKLVALDPNYADRDFLYRELGVYLGTRFKTPCETVFR